MTIINTVQSFESLLQVPKTDLRKHLKTVLQYSHGLAG